MDDSAKLDRTWLCSVLFMDIVSYSTRSVQIQVKLKERFTKYLSQAIREVAESDRVVLDTGDGAAVCFLGAPESAMFAALSLRSLFAHDVVDYNPSLRVRIGINLGPVKLVRDINGNLNAIGEGINTGQRVMNFAAENSILVSRTFFEVVSCISNDYEKLFRYEGVKQDKHTREHPVYQIVPPEQEDVAATRARLAVSRVAVQPTNTRPEARTATPMPAEGPREATAETRGPGGFDREMLTKLRTLLEPLAGPIAGHLVRRAAAQAADAAGLVGELSAMVEDAADRARFTDEALWVTGVNAGRAAAHPVQAAPAAAVVAAAPTAVPAPVTATAPAPVPAPVTAAAPAAEPVPQLDPVWMEKARSLLAEHIGPMARVLLERKAKHCRNQKELCHELADELPPGQRERFLAMLEKR